MYIRFLSVVLANIRSLYVVLANIRSLYVVLANIRSLFVVLAKYWTAPLYGFLYEPKHVGASVIVFFNYFIIEILYY
jgi:hypothetical protein